MQTVHPAQLIYFRNLKKAEEKLKSIYEEIEENKENVKQLESKLTELEEEATKVMEAYQESQVNILREPSDQVAKHLNVINLKKFNCE